MISAIRIPSFSRSATPNTYARSRILDRFARENFGKRVMHLAMRWVLDQPGVSVALLGARHPAQLEPLDQVTGWTWATARSRKSNGSCGIM